LKGLNQPIKKKGWPWTPQKRYERDRLNFCAPHGSIHQIAISLAGEMRKADLHCIYQPHL